jgi:hypothetical protein
VRHTRGDVQRDRHVRACGLSGEAYGVVEEYLIASDLDEERRQAREVGEDGADQNSDEATRWSAWWWE